MILGVENIKMSKLMVINFILSALTLFKVSWGTDPNSILVLEISQYDNCSSDVSFKSNRNMLLNSLATNAPLHGGSFKATVGKGSSKVYGLAQCRGDLPAAQCSNCTDYALKEALNFTECGVKMWSAWCFLGYSEKDFFGQWKEMATAVPLNYSQEIDPAMDSAGFEFMRELAFNASKQPQMFQVGVLNLGQQGKRYGMAQCYQYTKRSECRDCFNDQIDLALSATTGNWSSWMTLSSGCGMWYYDYQFYFNISTSAAGGSTIHLRSGRKVGGLITAALAFLYVL